ncbi:ATP-binding cassette domain-containing protein [Kutzneria viridogrisea]|uniref:ABC transporter ATP-binding protein n=1 Tax=Kutzneria viridogrisea TaxID=47990 RepID=UPI00296FDA8D
MSCTLAGGRIHGLIGRNGSGKTSLLSTLAAYRPASAGTVLVDGEDPFENPRTAAGTCFIRDEPDLVPSTVDRVLRFAGRFRPTWDHTYAQALAARFGLSPDKRVGALSRGMKSALGVTIGPASRAPLTIFDESYLGMDAPARYTFYEELIADYGRHPRTVLLSSHLIEEVDALFEQVLILDGGRLLLHEDTDVLRARGQTVTGPAEAVDRFVASLTVVGEKRLGGTKAVTVYGELAEDRRRQARAEGLDLGPISVQDLFVHLTREQGSPR